MRLHPAALLLVVACSTAPAAPAPSPADELAALHRPVATYSIVARDPLTGEMGVAVQSHWFSVGPVVPWAEAGVGAVATQAMVNIANGPNGLQLLRSGLSAPDALAALLAGDPARDVRQIGIVDAQGHAAAHTGAKCIVAAGNHVGDGYTCQANLMDKDTVWPAMAKAFEASAGQPLAERLLAALQAAEAQGGDIRGRQSAALLVVSGTNTGHPWHDRLVDLRVEDNPAPLDELARLLRLRRAYDHMDAGDLAVEHGDMDGAAREYGAAEALVPNNAEMLFWHGIAMAQAGRTDAALPLLTRAYGIDPAWRELVPRLPPAGLLDAKLVAPLTEPGAASKTKR